MDGRSPSLFPRTFILPLRTFAPTRRKDLTTQGAQHTTVLCIFLREEFFRHYRVDTKFFFRFEDPDFFF